MCRAEHTALLALLLAAGAGCPADPPGGDPPDAANQPGVDAGPNDPDATPLDQGLTFEFETKDPLPITASGNCVIERVELNLRDLRALGDGAPGDERTHKEALHLDFRPDENVAKLEFPDAPPGMYSTWRADVFKDGEVALRIEGTVDMGGGMVLDFTVEDTTTLAITVPLAGVKLDPGENEVVTLEVDVRAVLDPVDWSQVEIDEGDLEIDTGDVELAGIRARFATAWRQK